MSALMFTAAFALASGQSFAAYNGFLSEDEAPSVITLVEPPPADDSSIYQNDVEKFKAGQALKDTPRWRVAARDAVTTSDDDIAAYFSPAMGIEISKNKTPEIYRLISGTITDVLKRGTSKVKKYYFRPRPFLKLKEHTCRLADEADYANESSYPSGHATVGWGIALLLSEINPERADRILEKGRDYGNSRVICGYHWNSDVQTGRFVASIMLNALHANKAFGEQMVKAKAEFDALK